MKTREQLNIARATKRIEKTAYHQDGLRLEVTKRQRFSGVRYYSRIRPPKIKKAVCGDIITVVAKPHREGAVFRYHYEAMYVFNGKDWVMFSKISVPERK